MVSAYGQGGSKKRKNTVIARGPATDDKTAMAKLPAAPDMRVPDPKTGSLYSVNASGNARQGQKFQTRLTRKGKLHVYADGTQVLVKPKASASQTPRSLKDKPPRITEDDPNWNPYTMGNKRGYERGGGAKKYRKGRGRPD